MEISLDGEWELGFSEESKRFRWIKANVPGDVHLDLMKAGLLDEPLYGMNARKCLWVAQTTWHYRKKFHLQGFERDTKYELTFNGLDTTCTIHLNGHQIGKHDNMFSACTVDVTGYLVTGENILEVEIDSGVNQYRKKFPDIINLLKNRSQRNTEAIAKARMYIRKPAFSFGWDCAPLLLTCGIWRSVVLRKYKILALRDPYILTRLEGKNAKVNISFELEKFVSRRVVVEVRIEITKSGRRIAEVIKTVKVSREPVKESVHLENPLLWWPVSFGKPNLYGFSIRVYEKARLLASYSDRFGIRDIRLEKRNLGNGEKSFAFVINGKRIFAKGANWFPADSIVARVSKQKYKKLITLAREANFNMLRVWGGGIYEDGEFYRLCDENGIMVWQDFMFACSNYPDDDRKFMENVEKECEIAVKRLRNHPSIVLWCGNNECSQSKRVVELFGKYRGWRIFHRMLPALIRRFDPGRIYWPASPYAEVDDEIENVHNPGEGDRHSWIGVPDYRKYRYEKGKFISEFYAFAPSTKETLRRFLPHAEMKVDSETWKFHNNTWTWEPLFRRFAEREFMRGDKIPFDSYLLYYQLYQGEAYKFAIECFRRRKFTCSGSLFWMYTDCWGMTGSWTIVDYYLNKPLAYYYVKKAYASILLSFQEEKDGVSVWVVNDYLKKFPVTLLVRLIDFYKGEKKRWERQLVIEENTSCEILRIPLKRINANERARQYLYGELKCGGKVVADNTFFFETPKKLLLPETNLKRSYKLISNNAGMLTLKAHSFSYVVKISGLREGMSLEDNYFHINPGEEKTVLVKGKSISMADLRRIKIEALSGRVKTKASKNH